LKNRTLDDVQRGYFVIELHADDLAAAADRASEFLKSLANPVRLRILCLICDREVSVGDIAEALHVRQSVVSQHLALLRKDGLVSTRRDGQTIYYALADKNVVHVMSALQQAFCPTPGAVAAG